MERSEWLKRMRSMAEGLYDFIAPRYWVSYGFYENQAHLAYLQQFLDRVPPGGPLLSAACGAGRYDGLLLEAGHPVTGIDQSAGMLAKAQEHFPQAHYEKIGLQEMDFHAAFDGAICIDALEHVSPEDYPLILSRLQEALKPGGRLYFTLEMADPAEVQAAYERARARGLPVVYGELVDGVEEDYAQTRSGEPPDFQGDDGPAVYHFYPSIDQVRAWVAQAGLTVELEGEGSGYYHWIVRKG